MTWSLPVLAAVALVAAAIPAGAGHRSDPHTKNMQSRGHIVEPASLLNPAIGNPDIHTDIAFWGDHAFQGNWDGFNIRDISDPDHPTQVSRTFCDGNQGDVAVWDDILVRSWNSPAGAPGVGLTCDGQPVASGFEGVHIFDISDLNDPELIGSVETECGSHTATLVPDLANDRVVVYSNVSAGCNFIDVIEVPLSDPAAATLIHQEPLDHPCHDMGVILGDAMKAACAGGDGFDAFSLGGAGGGSLDDPEHLFHVMVPNVTIGHSAGFSWDGEVIVFGHEPGGGVASECEASDPDWKKSMFFFDSSDGTPLGMWTLPRPQSSAENCTIHNYNTVPLETGRDLVVHGSYQSGTSVVRFGNPANPKELGFSDPPPIVPTDLGGAWSSYWYNGYIYETNITEGLNIFKFRGPQAAGAVELDHLNPQTQEFTLP